MTTVEDILTTRRTDAARLEGALDALRRMGYAANGFEYCCVRCGWDQIMQHAHAWNGVLFSTVQMQDDAFEVLGLRALIDGTWYSQDDEDVPWENEPTAVEVDRSGRMTEPVFFQWGAHPAAWDTFFHDVSTAFTAAGFTVVLPEAGNIAIEVRP